MICRPFGLECNRLVVGREDDVGGHGGTDRVVFAARVAVDRACRVSARFHIDNPRPSPDPAITGEIITTAMPKLS